MKCFIASAFGHEDVDTIYERCIIPTLKKLSVTPLRVDRIVHNEDIDKKIFELLESADFIIADLTYARPSTYYEAGYAAGKSKPVIYIARSDHFKSRDDDPQGNLRVHFDLQMRNIIAWTDPDHVFSNKLLNRVRLVISPLERANKQNLQLDAERSEFNNLPLYDRLAILQKVCTNLLHAHSFQNYPWTIDTSNGNTPVLWSYLKRLDNSHYQGVGIITTSSPTKQLLQSLSWNPLYELPRGYPNFKFRETHFIVASLKIVPRSRITEALPHFHAQNTITLRAERKVANTTGTTYVHIIDGIKSKSEFAPIFRGVTNKYGL